MNKPLFACLCSTMVCLTTHAQQLYNTAWRVDDAGSLIGYVVFTEDTVATGVGLDNLTPVSLFTDNGSDFSITDFMGLCSGQLGQYTYSLSNDTLLWTVVLEPCSTRQTYFTLYNWTNVSQGIENASPAEPVAVFPIPATSQLHVQTLRSLIGQPYVIVDTYARIVASGRLLDMNETIDVQQLSAGTYLLDFITDQSLPVRFMKE